MPTPGEKLHSDWKQHYSDMPFEQFVGKVHGKFYSDIPFASFTDKMGLTSPPSPIVGMNTMPSVEGASPWEVGQVPPAKEMAGPAIRYGLPAAAGIAAGSIPGAGFIAGPIAAATTDLALSKAYGDGENDKARETSFLTDVGTGLLPSAAKGAYSIAKKLIPAPLEAKIASVIKWGFEKGVRPTVVGKGNAAQTAQYYKKAQSAVESIVENKFALQFADDAGNAIAGKLPQNLNQFSQSIDQTKRAVFAKYDAMLKHSEILGRTVDLDGVVSELGAFKSNRVNKMVGGTGNNRADYLIESMAGQKLTLSEAQDMIAQLNGRLKAFYQNPSPDLASSAAIDALAANRLRKSLDSAVEKYGYQELKNQYGALRSIEKEVSNRALVDARKNTKGLIDFADIATAAEAARAVATMSAGPAAAAGAIKALKEYYKYLNNPNRVIKKMFSEADSLIASRGAAVPLKALPPGPRPMPGKTPESYVKGIPAEYPKVNLLKPGPSEQAIKTQIEDIKNSIVYWQRGGGTVIDDMGKVTGKVPSTYPSWFKIEFPNDSANTVMNSANKYLKGKPLGKKDIRIVNKLKEIASNAEEGDFNVAEQGWKNLLSR